MTLSMTDHFFNIDKKESAQLFSEFKISADSDFCEQHQNTYPVINISLKSGRGRSWKESFSIIRTLISRTYRNYKHLLSSDKLEEYEKDYIKKVMYGEEVEDGYALSLLHLSEYLNTHFGRKVIILIDEYDTPIIGGYTEKYYDDVISFMRVFLGAAFKENPYLHKGLITGIMRIARESIFSEMNNVGVYTILDPYFANKFGFTEEETIEILAYFDLKDKYDNVKGWYNGYRFGGIGDMYNPWSIINYISRKEQGFKPYWINTGTDPLIRERILKPDTRETYTTLQTLISGEAIKRRLYEDFIFPDFDTDKELLWTLLTFSGYLTQVEETEEQGVYALKIPNYEIKTVFRDIIIKWLQRDLNIQRRLVYTTAQHLVNNRIAEFEEGFRQIMEIHLVISIQVVIRRRCIRLMFWVCLQCLAIITSFVLIGKVEKEDTILCYCRMTNQKMA